MMEYEIRSKRPFPEIEHQTVGALVRHGFVVRQTFSLHSATEAVMEELGPGYSVFMVYETNASKRPSAQLTLYQRGGRTLILPALTSEAYADMDADLVAAFVSGGLELCIDGADSEACIDPELVDK
jgi:hypothetical protein